MKYYIKYIILPFLFWATLSHNNCIAQCVVTLWSDSTIRIRTATFLDSTRGILLSSQGKVLWTIDGGLTWDNRTGIYVELQDVGLDRVIMFDSVTATIITPRNVYRTTDAGVTWQLQLTNESLNFNAAFSDANHGIIVSDNGQVFHTNNGGAQWITRIVGGTQDWRGVTYPDSLHAFISGGYRFFKTIDGGISWMELDNPDPAPLNWKITSVAFIDSNIGMLTTEPILGKFSVFRTTNAGVTWSAASITSGYTFGNLHYVTRNICIANAGQIILSTMDGGVQWKLSRLPAIGVVHMSYFPFNKIIISGNVVSNNKYVGNIYTTSNNPCSPSTAMQHPPNGATNLTLSHTVSYPNSTHLQWNYQTGPIWAYYSHVQFSPDSSFPAGSTVDTIIAAYPSSLGSLIVRNLSSNTAYYWRLRSHYVDGTYSDWSDVWKFTTAGGTITGIVFDDIDHDGVRDEDEPGMQNLPIYVWSHIETELRTDGDGRFTSAGLDSGNYVIEAYIYPGWELTFPQLWYYEFIMNGHDTVSNIDFGFYFPWNYISGTLFHDENENLVSDSGEHGLESWTVYMHGPLGYDSTTTDSAGNYIFKRLTIGTHQITVAGQPSWIQTYPQYQLGYSLTFTAYDQHLNQAVFGFGHSPPKVKNKITVNDYSQAISTSIWWGTRPGAAYGIWSVDQQATSVDFSEGEAEVPPPVPGGFDVRFVNPNLSYEYFGYGSWVDMKNYFSPAQIDTYRITFSPALSLGGGYPMKFRWSKEEVTNSYGSCVLLEEISNDTFDMKLLDSLILENPNIGSLLLIAQGPKLPSSDASGDELNIPDVFYLGQNYPNPFNGTTTISYSLPAASFVSIKILDVLGRGIATLFSGQQREGTHQLHFDASMLSSGIYFYSLVSEKGIQTRKMLLLR